MWNTALIFSKKNVVYNKKLFVEQNSFAADYEKIIELHIVHT